MKKIFCTVISLLVIVSLASCSKSKKFDVVEVSGYADDSIVERHGEIELNVETYQKKFKSKQTATVNGKKISGDYSMSKKSYLFNSDVDYYEYSKAGSKVQFGINAKTGIVDSYSYVDMNYVTSKSGAASLTENQCSDIALQYFSQYVDTDKYSLVASNYLEIPEYGAIYDFEFVFLVDGIQTSDSAFIGVTIYGDVISHMFSTLNEFEGLKPPSNEDNEVIAGNIDAKIKNMYDSISDKYDYSWNNTEKVFVKLSDGTYALEYYISVKLVPQNALAKEAVETVKLLVYID